jgi:activating signal cointegrator 1
MKALTIHQPYASWIIDGAKWVENRTWATGYRGPLAIHAGLSQVELRRLHCQGTYPHGVILGHVQLVACETLERMRELAAEFGDDYRLPSEEPHVSRSIIELLEHNHTWGPVCWILENPVMFREPIPAKGRQGLWEWEAEVA